MEFQFIKSLPSSININCSLITAVRSQISFLPQTARLSQQSTHLRSNYSLFQLLAYHSSCSSCYTARSSQQSLLKLLAHHSSRSCSYYSRNTAVPLSQALLPYYWPLVFVADELHTHTHLSHLRKNLLRSCSKNRSPQQSLILSTASFLWLPAASFRIISSLRWSFQTTLPHS